MLQQSALTKYFEDFQTSHPDVSAWDWDDVARYIIIADFNRGQAENDPTIMQLFAAVSIIGNYIDANCKSVTMTAANIHGNPGFMVSSRPQGTIGLSDNSTHQLASAIIEFAKNIARAQEEN